MSTGVMFPPTPPSHCPSPIGCAPTPTPSAFTPELTPFSASSAGNDYTHTPPPGTLSHPHSLASSPYPECFAFTPSPQVFPAPLNPSLGQYPYGLECSQTQTQSHVAYGTPLAQVHDYLQLTEQDLVGLGLTTGLEYSPAHVPFYQPVPVYPTSDTPLVPLDPTAHLAPTSGVYSHWPYPQGHEPVSVHKACVLAQDAAEHELNALLAPRHVLDIARCLQVLDEMLEPCAVAYGPAALVKWLHHVQTVTIAVKRFSIGQPLPTEHKELCRVYAEHWRCRRGGACDLGRPEAQIVLITLAELVDY